MQLDTKIDLFTIFIKKYLKTNLELIKLEALERSSVISSNIIGMVIVGILAVFFMLFTSIFLAFYLSSFFSNNYAGFAIVAGFYLIVTIIIYFNKKKWIEIPICNSIIKKNSSIS